MVGMVRTLDSSAVLDSRITGAGSRRRFCCSPSPDEALLWLSHCILSNMYLFYLGGNAQIYLNPVVLHLLNQV